MNGSINNKNLIDQLPVYNSIKYVNNSEQSSVQYSENVQPQQQQQQPQIKSLNPMLFTQELQQEYQQWLQNKNMNQIIQSEQNQSQQPNTKMLIKSEQNSIYSIQESYAINSYNTQGIYSEVQIIDQQKMNPNISKQSKYDLEKGLSFEVKSLKKHFQFNSNEDQIIPVMVSVKTLDETSENKDGIREFEVSNLQNSRPSLDLICVIDNSGSMQGAKMQSVKQTLKELVFMLGENDRLALITFNSRAQQLCNLKTVKEANKQYFQDIIQSINHSNGTNISSGIETAFNILQNRKQSNIVTSIFLLSDGQHKSADLKIKKLLSTTYSSLSKECFTIHSFGYGNDHDASLMTSISQIKDGSFYYVDKIDQVDEFFVDALGGLFSVIAQDISIDIFINREDKIFDKYFKSSTVERTYGPMWKIVKNNSHYSIKINQLFSGVSKDFILEIKIPKIDVQNLSVYERNIQLVSAQLSAIPVDDKYSTKIIKMNNLVLTLFTSNERIPQDSEANINVEFNYLRVNAAQAIKDSMELADQNKFEFGQQILSEMISKLENSHPHNREKLKIIKEDLISCQKNAKPQIYQSSGKSAMIQQCNNNFTQASYAIRKDDIYNCKRQSLMVQQLQFLKDKSSKKN